MTEISHSPVVGPNADARALQRRLYREIGIGAVAAALAIDAPRKSLATPVATRPAIPRPAAAA